MKTSTIIAYVDDKPVAWLPQQEQYMDVDGKIIPLVVLDTRRGHRMALCGLMVKCWDSLQRPCLRDKNHELGCNPFSDSVPTGTIPAGSDHEKAARGIQIQMDAECHRKAVEAGETTFTLVEHDPASPKTILFWIMENFNGKVPAAKLRDAFDDALQMLFSPVVKRRAD